MREYVLRRLLQMIPTILMITLVVFAMMQTIPGDPIITLLGDAYNEEDAMKLRHAYGLDKPLVVQYLIWLGRLVRGLGHVDSHQPLCPRGRAQAPRSRVELHCPRHGGGAAHCHSRRHYGITASKHLG